MQRIGRFALIVFQIAVLSALIVVTRCANYQDVFVAGNIYFVDADCYARMTRVQLVSAKPGLIVRHHAFENFPNGTTPHTTAPLDYLIFAFSLLLRPFSSHALDLAGAFISPALALIGGWFLWWWSRQMRFRYGWVMLTLYAISPILVQGTQLGRPDHQSLSILLVAIGICAEWMLRTKAETAASADYGRWSVASGVSWGLAIWNSAYEPLFIFLLVIGVSALESPKQLLAKRRRIGWSCFVLTIALATLIERRLPSSTILLPDPIFTNWARTIGELAHVSPANPIWLRWCGYFLLIAPFLLWMTLKMRSPGASGCGRSATALQAGGRALPVFVVLIATYCLTIWEVRWAYFFVLIFALALAPLLQPIKSRAAVWIAFLLSIVPILRDWDERLWPNETQLAIRFERRHESAQLRDLAINLRSAGVRAFLAPWWLSPSIAYWSGQPGVAGSSHESLRGIEDSARFFLSDDLQKAREILTRHDIGSVVAYDSDRVAANSSAILRLAVPARPLCWVLDRRSSEAPPFLVLSAQNGAGKLYRAD